jgi:hypothetical protein
MMIADGRVLLGLRPVGLAVPDKARVAVPHQGGFDRLGVAAESGVQIQAVGR